MDASRGWPASVEANRILDEFKEERGVASLGHVHDQEALEELVFRLAYHTARRYRPRDQVKNSGCLAVLSAACARLLHVMFSREFGAWTPGPEERWRHLSRCATLQLGRDEESASTLRECAMLLLSCTAWFSALREVDIMEFLGSADEQCMVPFFCGVFVAHVQLEVLLWLAVDPEERRYFDVSIPGAHFHHRDIFMLGAGSEGSVGPSQLDESVQERRRLEEERVQVLTMQVQEMGLEGVEDVVRKLVSTPQRLLTAGDGMQRLLASCCRAALVHYVVPEVTGEVEGEQEAVAAAAEEEEEEEGSGRTRLPPSLDDARSVKGRAAGDWAEALARPDNTLSFAAVQAQINECDRLLRMEALSLLRRREELHRLGDEQGAREASARARVLQRSHGRARFLSDSALTGLACVCGDLATAESVRRALHEEHGEFWELRFPGEEALVAAVRGPLLLEEVEATAGGEWMDATRDVLAAQVCHAAEYMLLVLTMHRFQMRLLQRASIPDYMLMDRMGAPGERAREAVTSCRSLLEMWGKCGELPEVSAAVTRYLLRRLTVSQVGCDFEALLGTSQDALQVLEAGSRTEERVFMPWATVRAVFGSRRLGCAGEELLPATHKRPFIMELPSMFLVVWRGPAARLDWWLHFRKQPWVRCLFGKRAKEKEEEEEEEEGGLQIDRPPGEEGEGGDRLKRQRVHEEPEGPEGWWSDSEDEEGDSDTSDEDAWEEEEREAVQELPVHMRQRRKHTPFVMARATLEEAWVLWLHLMGMEHEKSRELLGRVGEMAKEKK